MGAGVHRRRPPASSSGLSGTATTTREAALVVERGESYWDAARRTAEAYGARFFVVANTVYYFRDENLMAAQPTLTLARPATPESRPVPRARRERHRLGVGAPRTASHHRPAHQRHRPPAPARRRRPPRRDMRPCGHRPGRRQRRAAAGSVVGRRLPPLLVRDDCVGHPGEGPQAAGADGRRQRVVRRSAPPEMGASASDAAAPPRRSAARERSRSPAPTAPTAATTSTPASTSASRSAPRASHRSTAASRWRPPAGSARPAG